MGTWSAEMTILSTYTGGVGNVPSGPCAFPFEDTRDLASSLLVKTRQTGSIRRLIDDNCATSYE